MRIRNTEQPPTKNVIDRIIREGALEEDRKRFPALLRRLKKAFFLDVELRPLSPRERLIRQYKEDGLVLFLGAGVSSGSGIPAWPELAQRLLLNSGIAQDELPDISKAFPSLIIQFELAACILGSNKKLIEELYRSLYATMECKRQLEKIPRKYEDQIRWTEWSEALKALECNKTLAAVGDLLIADDDKTGLRRNPQIHAVLTVNADNLLELYCEAKTNGKRVITMVDRASVGDHPDQTPVYHLHGTLDARGENVFRCAPPTVRQNELQEINDELLPNMVFRESEYYETIANPASFINHTPQSLFRRLNALFIGTSLDDLNMRRWLHDSFTERVRHRAKFLREFYWKQYAEARYEAMLESRRHFWLRPETQNESDNKIWRVPKKHVESVMNNLGIQIVWCTDYEDMQKCIIDIRELGQDPQFGQRNASYPT
jgi:hypothetical protein